MDLTPALPLLIAELAAAKVAEAAARDTRLAIEERILAHFPAPATGEGSAKSGDMSIVWKVTRKVDATLADQWNNLGKNAQSAFKWKPDVDLKALRALQQLDADGYAQAARFITTTPAKPAITLKESA